MILLYLSAISATLSVVFAILALKQLNKEYARDTKI